MDSEDRNTSLPYCNNFDFTSTLRLAPTLLIRGHLAHSFVPSPSDCNNFQRLRDPNLRTTIPKDTKGDRKAPAARLDFTVQHLRRVSSHLRLRRFLPKMAVSSIQDRTKEFRSVLTQVQRRQASSKVGAQRQSLLTDAQKAANGNANGDGKPRRSEFARRAAEIGRGISATMGKLEKLAQCRNHNESLLQGLYTDQTQWPNEKRSSTTGPSRLTS